MPKQTGVCRVLPSHGGKMFLFAFAVLLKRLEKFDQSDSHIEIPSRPFFNASNFSADSWLLVVISNDVPPGLHRGHPATTLLIERSKLKPTCGIRSVTLKSDRQRNRVPPDSAFVSIPVPNSASNVESRIFWSEV